MFTTSNQRFQKLTLLVVVVINPVFFNSIFAQDSNNLSFTTEFSSKFSIGKEVRGYVEYEPGFTINFPKASTYMNPVYTLEFGPNYDITKKLNIGASVGIGVVQNVPNPLTANQYFNRVLFPLTANIGYQSGKGGKLTIVPRLKVGYQFLISQFGSTDEGFLYEQTGGLILAIDFGLTKKIGKYSPSIMLGYELSTINNDVSLGWIDGFNYEDKYQFSTSYHLVKIGFGINY